ncbi:MULTISPECIES: LLM class flavin-dependent oxidoreductase [unclassified Rhizobium]|jgi:alkanesulfonate monooxygenase SsuD/methylene tetrahydromethanopterin reductase-like flavin-dependent oxidoreductase (luciferase family)|uniref:LLM class flavin-dependent oxidoreductase n=1 Tax=unclassified Rhizobium TaxID=2613769 RepID=UPI000647AF5D|nr:MULTISPECIES: LLM class flavin-dependent oxidoreductase [unclassified Rhizobium]MBN8950700.1 LLM class flavin-dependent oxidoreductase [Rhizobium tropici]RKD69198.1 alkanesulfonate monooxygenase SsuD/methylene tetrahydromethanopterin reductase-like flavin-dependent oxidoreductase (luciferase family) [Rhizobium sp. WW_1]
MTKKKQVILGAQFPGVNNFTVWSDPAAGSQIEFSSFRHFVETVEQGKFDFMFLAEGLRIREQKGRFYELDVAGRPNTLAILTALAAITEHVGLIGTLTTTFNEPYALARQLATLDILSAGRAGWNVVTSPDAFTGANFRRGDHLPYEERYERARGFVDAAQSIWSGREFSIRSRYFDIDGRSDLGPLPQGAPVIAQAGDSDQGREFAASHADLIYSRHGSLEAGQAFYQDVKKRLAKYGRSPDALKILPGANFVIGDTQADADEKLKAIRRQQVSPKGAIAFLEQVWNKDLSSYDPEGPLPEVEPDVSAERLSHGRTTNKDTKGRLETARQWREIAERDRLSIRELAIRVTGRKQFVGTPESIADEINRYVQADAADGFVFAPHLTPGGFDEFVEKIVPLLQERGVYRREYVGATLRANLGLPEPLEDRRALRHLSPTA